MEPEAKRRRVASRVLVAAGLLLLLGNGACAVAWGVLRDGGYEGLEWAMLGLVTLPVAVIVAVVALALAARRGVRSAATLYLAGALAVLGVATWMLFGGRGLAPETEPFIVPLWGASAVLAALAVVTAWRR